MSDLAFFTGPECELCDHAWAIIDDLKLDYPVLETMNITTFNIRENSEHYHLYAVRIPVLKRMDTQEELGWPFDHAILREFLSL